MLCAVAVVNHKFQIKSNDVVAVADDMKNKFQIKFNAVVAVADAVKSKFRIKFNDAVCWCCEALFVFARTIVGEMCS